MKKTKMITRLLICILLLVVTVLAAGCGDDKSVSGKTEGGGELILGKNAFGVSFSVTKVSKEPVTFIVEPLADQWGDKTNVFTLPEGKAIWGKNALVAGQKKGSKATLDGSFTLYANDKNGPSVTVIVKGTYEIDEEGYCETDDHMFYYLYEDGQFIKSDKASVYK